MSAWRTEATTARRTASRSRARPGGASPDAPAAACRGVQCDRLGAVGRTPRELLTDGGGEVVAEVRVLIGPAVLLACPATGAQVGVGQTLLRGLFDRRRLRQDALPLIAIASCAPAHHDRGQLAGLRGAPSQRGITGRQKLEIHALCSPRGRELDVELVVAEECPRRLRSSANRG